MNTGESAVSICAATNQPKALKMLMGREDLLISRASKRGYSPLHKAVEKQHHEVLQILLEAGAAVNVTTDLGTFVLFGLVTFKKEKPLFISPV